MVMASFLLNIATLFLLMIEVVIIVGLLSWWNDK